RFAAKKRGAFEALSRPILTNIATKNEPGVYHCPPHVFLGAVGNSYFISFSNRSTSHSAKCNKCPNEISLDSLVPKSCLSIGFNLTFSYSLCDNFLQFAISVEYI